MLSETQFPHLKIEGTTTHVLGLFLGLNENIRHYGSRKGSMNDRYFIIIIIASQSSLTGEERRGGSILWGPVGGLPACKRTLPSSQAPLPKTRL